MLLLITSRGDRIVRAQRGSGGSIARWALVLLASCAVVCGCRIAPTASESSVVERVASTSTTSDATAFGCSTRGDRRAEVSRIRRHLDRAIALMGRRDLSSLSAAQRSARLRNLAVLEAYRDRGRFPRNRDFPGELVPYFRDADGTLCAVGYLMHASGEAALVDRIAASANHAVVAELAYFPGVADWLAENGISAEEAAWIQPRYGYVAYQCFCGAWRDKPVHRSAVIGTLRDGLSGVEIRIQRAFGAPATAGVGSSVPISDTAGWASGDRVIAVPTESGGDGGPGSGDGAVRSAPLRALYGIDPQGSVHCTHLDDDCGMRAADDFITALPAAVAADAITSADCAQKLIEHDGDWNESIRCGPEPGGGGCCGLSGSGGETQSTSPELVGWLLGYLALALLFVWHRTAGRHTRDE